MVRSGHSGGMLKSALLSISTDKQQLLLLKQAWSTMRLIQTAGEQDSPDVFMRTSIQEVWERSMR